MRYSKQEVSEIAPDDVDRIVSTLLADPTRADDMKRLLRKKLRAPDLVRVALPSRSRAGQISEDVEDMWDNVPV